MSSFAAKKRKTLETRKRTKRRHDAMGIGAAGSASRMMRETLYRHEKATASSASVDSSNKKPRTGTMAMDSMLKRVEHVFVGISDPTVRHTEVMKFVKKVRALDGRHKRKIILFVAERRDVHKIAVSLGYAPPKGKSMTVLNRTKTKKAKKTKLGRISTVAALHAGTLSTEFEAARDGIKAGWLHTIVTTDETATEAKLHEWGPYDVVISYAFPDSAQAYEKRALLATREYCVGESKCNEEEGTCAPVKVSFIAKGSAASASSCHPADLLKWLKGIDGVSMRKRPSFFKKSNQSASSIKVAPNKTE